MCFAAREIAKKVGTCQPVSHQPTMQQAAVSLDVEKLQKEADDTGISWSYSSNTWEFPGTWCLRLWEMDAAGLLLAFL